MDFRHCIVCQIFLILKNKLQPQVSQLTECYSEFLVSLGQT